jgi:peptidoglycan/xylan/chitin deacetylase (PgdA/CDA1 family)
MIIAVLIFITAVLIYLTLEYSLLIPPTKEGLPVLMYHKVSQTHNNGLTVSTEKLRKHFEYLQKKGYSTISFKELEQSQIEKIKLPKKPIIITFDDGYQNNYDLALPLLQEFNFKATIFLPVYYIGKVNEWDKENDPIMDYNTIKKCTDTGLIEFGVHSYKHQSYKEMTINEIKIDLQQCTTDLDKNNINYVKVLAYPYGAFPKKDIAKKEKMKELFKQTNITFALRIKNRINKLPISDIYEVKRIDIKGIYNFFEFKTKVKKGRTKMF